MYKIRATYRTGKDFERERVTRVSYKTGENIEVVVCGNALGSHVFPVDCNLLVVADDGQSLVSHKGLRVVSVFDVPDREN